MIRFRLGDMEGSFEDGALSLTGGELAEALQPSLQAMIDYDIAHHEGYLPGMDASARRILVDMGATITEEPNDTDPGVIY